MKSILSASVCAAVLAFAVPAMAATDPSTTTPLAHHMSKHHGMMKGKKGMKGKMSGDAAVQDLNAKSLAAAKAGQPMEAGSGTMSPASSSGAMPAPMAPAAGMPATGTSATTTPSNAPGGQ